MSAIESSMESQSLTESQWQAAHAIAIELVKSETDVNELGKAIAYLRATVSKPDAGSKFFKYIKTLRSNGKQIGHSGKTLDYYRNIDVACDRDLRNYQDDGEAMLQILGWASRLMRYYKTAPIAELEVSHGRAAVPDVQAQRMAEIKASIQSQKFEKGQVVDAKIVGKKDKGKEVTYEIVGTSIRLTNKEPKKYDVLLVDQVVNVEIIEVNDDIPKKIKRLD